MSHSHSHWDFLRYGFYAALLAIAFVAGAYYSMPRPVDKFVVAPPIGAVQLELPQPALSPTQVVRLQMAGLRGYRDDPAALQQCYCFASLANRAIAGPFERFERIALGREYYPLLTQRHATIGEAVVRDDLATVLVTVVDRQKRLVAYRFYLSKQRERPYRDCWMTDAVFAVELPPAAPPPAELTDA